jgi:hypothetical protein
VSLVDKYVNLKQGSEPSLFDRFATIEQHLATLVTQNSAMGESLKKMVKQLDEPVRISTWGSSHISLVNTNEQPVINPGEVVAFAAWVEGAPLAGAGVALVFDDTTTTPNFHSTIAGPIPNPRKVALSGAVTGTVHVILLTSSLGGMQTQ